MSSARVINMTPLLTDIIKLDPTEQTIWMGSGNPGMYLEMTNIEVPDINLNSHIKNLSGFYESQYEITGIRMRNHYPHFPGNAWRLVASYIFTELAPLKCDNTEGFYYRTPYYGFLTLTNPTSIFIYNQKSIPIPSDNPDLLSGGNWKVPCRASYVTNQSFLKEDIFFGYKDGMSVAETESEERQYYSMYYNYKAPYAPTETDSAYYCDDLSANITGWIEGNINRSEKTWEFPNIEMTSFFTNITRANYSFTGQNTNDNLYDPRLQCLEFQIYTRDGKSATRLYFVYHVPQGIPSTYMSGYYYQGTIGKTQLLNNNPTYPAFPEYRILQDKLYVGVEQVAADYTTCLFVVAKPLGDKLPLRFPLTGGFTTETITETISNIYGICYLKTPALQGTIEIPDWEETEETPVGNQFRVTYDERKTDYSGLFGVVIYFGNQASKTLTITYDTAYISTTEIVSIKSCKSKTDNPSLLHSQPSASDFDLSTLVIYDLNNVKGYDKYFLESDEWTSIETNSVNNTHFWITMNLQNSNYINLGSGWQGYCRMTPPGNYGDIPVKGKFVHDSEWFYNYTWFINRWLYYATIYNYVASSVLYNFFTEGRFTGGAESWFIYRSGAYDHINEFPDTATLTPEWAGGNFHFRKWEVLCRGLHYGVYGFTNDGQRNRSFVNCVNTSVGNVSIGNPYNENSNPEGFQFFACIGLPLNTTPTADLNAFGQRTDPVSPARYNIYPIDEDGKTCLNSAALIHGYSTVGKPFNEAGISDITLDRVIEEVSA